MMKVKELQKWLNDFDGELEIVIGDYGDGTETYIKEIDGIEQIEAEKIKSKEPIDIVIIYNNDV